MTSKSVLMEKAYDMVTRGREARSIMGNPAVQEFFREELELAFETFASLDVATKPGELATLHFRSKALVDLMDHLEQAIVAGDQAGDTLRKQEE